MMGGVTLTLFAVFTKWSLKMRKKVTAIPQELKEKAGVFCLHLPHGRDESTQKSSSPFQVHRLASDLFLQKTANAGSPC